PCAGDRSLELITSQPGCSAPRDRLDDRALFRAANFCRPSTRRDRDEFGRITAMVSAGAFPLLDKTLHRESIHGCFDLFGPTELAQLPKRHRAFRECRDDRSLER